MKKKESVEKTSKESPENIEIPKIKLDDSRQTQVVAQSDSILDPPKINLNKDAKPVVVSQGIPMKGKTKVKKILLVSGVVLLFFAIVGGIFGLLAYNTYQKGMKLYSEAEILKAKVKTQNLNEIKSGLTSFEKELSSFRGSYQRLAFVKIVPYFGEYWQDGERSLKAAGYGIDAVKTLLDTIEPYADLVGLDGGQDKNKDGAKTAQERIDFIVNSIGEVVPKLDEISKNVNLAKDELNAINIDKYPETFKGMKLRDQMKEGVSLLNNAAVLLTDGKPILEVAPTLLGTKEKKTYLVLFQNDKEIRPTGGFITAYAMMKIEKGRFDQVASSDIYSLDNKYKPRIPAPDPIIKYLKGPYVLSKNFRLRDINFSPDFEESMKLFAEEAKTVGLTGYDGIIAVDTHVVVSLLNVLGKIGVPGYGNFSTDVVPECNCPQVIYELESFADVEGPIVWDPVSGEIVYRPPHSDNRKGIIGPLMNSILANTMGQPKDKLPKLFEAAFKSVTEKHVLFYFFDEKSQNAASSFNIAGKIKEFDGDYIHLNDSNLGGRKSNLYVTQEIEDEIEVGKDGSVVSKLSVTYKNPQKFDGWLNSVLPNWVRLYVPRGSELVSVEGLEEKIDPYEDLGKTVFAGYFKLRPQGVVKVTYKYKLPFKAKKELKLLIQKQPGLDAPLYSVSVNGKKEEFYLRTDKELKFRI